ncbi:hypothetical protein ET495_06630 [Xylanimonas allomyrinae]|uniref:DUF4190 domain-containing protein n=1 Tax=Xylanimonas allomyrinae TaxID=2509459 RepID=A0A4V0YE49_9MICO|nr:DUF4190 domain-containing protein [Xylanimonas allomyrinae]QAY62971.1 hypothetical protein ET495_06630 [Xylanimonas allomyrinae]
MNSIPDPMAGQGQPPHVPQPPAEPGAWAPAPTQQPYSPQPQYAPQQSYVGQPQTPQYGGPQQAYSGQPLPYGGPQQPMYASSVEDPGKTLGLVGLIGAFVAPLVGLICSIIGYNKSKKAGFDNKLALWGIIVSAAFTVISLLACLLLLLGAVADASAS